MENIIVALITGLCSVFAVAITNSKSNEKITSQLNIAQAVTDTKIETLTEEVRKHNNFAEKIPAIEEHLKMIDIEIKDLKGYHR